MEAVSEHYRQDDEAPHGSITNPSALVWRQKVVDALTRRVHPQNGWLWPSLFQQMVKKRGLDTGIGESRLEKWDKMGIFHPLIRYRYPITTHRKLSEDGWRWEQKPYEGEITDENAFINIVNNGWRPEHIHKPRFAEKRDELLQVATAENFTPWNDYRARDDRTTSLGGVYYHPFQIFRLEAALRACKISCTFTDFEASERVREWFQSDLERARLHLAEREVCDLKTLYVLARIEDKYLPRWRGARHQIHVKGNVDDEVQSTWHEWVEGFDPAEVLRTGDLSIEEIMEIREGLAWQGQCLDPNRSFYLLFRHFSHEQRQSLEDRALLAWNYYEAAEMIGWFLEDATDEKQRATDDLNRSTGWWKKDRYGVEADAIDFNEGNILRRLLHQYTLDPTYKVLLVVEGESEAAFIRTWCEITKMNLELLGVRLLILEGINGLSSKTTRQTIEQAKKDGAGIIVVVDDEVDSTTKIDEWVKDGLLPRRFDLDELHGPNSPLGGLVWSPCFEEANFTLDQLLDAWFALLEEWHRERGSDRVVQKAEVRELVERIRQNPPSDKKGKPRVCNSWIDAMILAGHWLRLPLSKPELAVHLARLWNREDIPIIRLIYHCRHIAVMATNYGPPLPDGGFGYLSEATVEQEANENDG